LLSFAGILPSSQKNIVVYTSTLNYPKPYAVSIFFSAPFTDTCRVRSQMKFVYFWCQAIVIKYFLVIQGESGRLDGVQVSDGIGGTGQAAGSWGKIIKSKGPVGRGKTLAWRNHFYSFRRKLKGTRGCESNRVYRPS
jgi:hypothetical protein